MTTACRGDVWAVQDVTHNQCVSTISVLFCSSFERSNTLLLVLTAILIKFDDLIKVELHVKTGCKFALPLVANILFATLLE